MQEKSNSLEAQIKQCEEFANLKNFEIVEILTDIESGTKDDRSGYLRLKELIKNREFDTLIVYETSRISRKLIELLLFIELLQTNEIDFISATETGYDTTTPEGKFAMSIRLSMIQFERDNIAKRVTERLYFKASKGQWLNGKPPRGYILQDKKLIIDEPEAEIVRDIFKRFLDGESMYRICEIHDLKWGSKQVKRILTNPTYTGHIRYGNRKHTGNDKKDILVKGLHKPIISEEDFKQVQELLKQIKRTPLKSNRYLLNGILKCKNCGNSVLGIPGKQYQNYPHYGCNLKRLKFSDKLIYKDQNCDSANIKSSLLEKAIIDELKKEIKKLEGLENVQYNEGFIDLSIIRKNINKLKSKRERILDAYIDGNLHKDIYLKRIKILEEEIILMEKKLLNKPKKIDFQSNKEKIIKYFNSIDFEDIEKANSVLRLMIDKIIVLRKKEDAKDEFEIEIYLNII